MSALCCRLLLGLIIITSAVTSHAEEEDPKFYHMFTHLPGDLKVWGQETFTKEAIPYALSLTAATGVLMFTDYDTWQITKIKFDENKDFQNNMIFFEQFGGGYFQISMGLGFMGLGYLTGNKRILRTAFQIGESILASGVLVQISKRSSGRESPKSSEEKTGRWRPFPDIREYNTHVRDYDAMPSGHLSSVFTTLIVIQENYPEYKWIPWVGYPMIGLLCLSFSATSIHWWSDYPLGIYLGYHFAKIVTRNNHKVGDSLKKDSGYQLFPTYDEDGTPLLSAVWAW